MLEDLLSPQDLAHICKVPLPTVYRWNHTGDGPKALHIGRHVRYRPEDVDAWLAEQEVER